MTNHIVQDHDERPVPKAWREVLKRIADAFVLGNMPGASNIRPVDDETAAINAANIADYPDPIGPLCAASWTASICGRFGDHWEVLVDLSTVSGETSDLVLHVRVFDVAGRTMFEPGLIFVP
ncbi:MAG: hypothetical protein AAGH41_13555 [Pseudomonadota bacterium]